MYTMYKVLHQWNCDCQIIDLSCEDHQHIKIIYKIQIKKSAHFSSYYELHYADYSLVYIPKTLLFY